MRIVIRRKSDRFFALSEGISCLGYGCVGKRIVYNEAYGRGDTPEAAFADLCRDFAVEVRETFAEIGRQVHIWYPWELQGDH